MSDKIILEVTAGPIQGETFVFNSHDTFIFGREQDCHAKLAANDITASRHHFLLEVNPPYAQICDLGSLNGTHINGVKHGGRPKNMTPEEAALITREPIDIKDGDEIRVGNTFFKVSIESPVSCHNCRKILQGKEIDFLKTPPYYCAECSHKAKNNLIETLPEDISINCDKCGKNVAHEIPTGLKGNYVCESCRSEARKNPLDVLTIIRQHNGDENHSDINEYQIIKELGKGGMGAVYLANRKSDDKKVAIKTMLAQIAVSQHARAVFQREIEITKELKHSNIVELYDYGSSGSGFFFTLEFCSGGSIADLMLQRRSTLSLRESLKLILQALDGLSFAHNHEKVFVHRDLKPHNILITSSEGGIAKISDFGLAKSFQNAGLSGMTVTGQKAGSFAFMPKEQLTNFKRVKPVSDVWSMAATLYFMLTAQTPIDFPVGKSPAEVLMQANIVPIRKRNSEIPNNIAAVIEQALSKDILERYKDAGEFKAALQKVA